MPRKVYPQKLAEELAVRLTTKLGEPHEARMTPSGWAVFAQSEPDDEVTELRPEASDWETPDFTELHKYAKADVAQSLKLSILDVIAKEIAAKLDTDAISALHGKVASKGYAGLKQAYSAKQPPPQVAYPELPSKGSVKKAGPYEAFKQAHSSGKQHTKGGKKLLQAAPSTPVPPPLPKLGLLKSNWGVQAKAKNVIGMPFHWVSNVPESLSGVLHKIVHALHLMNFDFTVGGYFEYNAVKHIISLYVTVKAWETSNPAPYEFYVQWVASSNVEYIAKIMSKDMKVDGLLLS